MTTDKRGPIMRKGIAGLTAAFALAALALQPAAADESKINKSDNVKHVANIKFDGGGELAAIENTVYAGESMWKAPEYRRGTDPNAGGIHIISSKGKPKEIGFLHCPGQDNDVEVIRPGLVVQAFTSNKCALTAGEGLMTVDVSNPKKPKVLGHVNTNKAHTMKPFPGKPLVYMAKGGITPGGAAGPAIVDVSDPRKPEVVAQGRTYTMDCHDISFYVGNEKSLGFCAGAVGTGEVQIFDVSDPLNPTLLGKIYNPAIQYSHYAIANHDGTLLAIDDEAFAAHDCNTGQSPTGRVWIYDISIPQVPLLQSSYAPPRGGDGTTNIGTYAGWVASWCLSHGLDWHPNSNHLAVTWFTGGTSVLDVSNALQPSEFAYFQPEGGLAYSTLWHDDRLYINDTARGVDVLEIKGVPKMKKKG